MSARRRRTARLGGLAALGLGAFFSACSVHIGDPNNPVPEGRPCSSDRDCPQPANPCQVWTCYQEVCTAISTAKDTLLPKESQVAGDCKVLVCDGQGQPQGIADKTDEPPEDDNPCAEEICDNGAPAYPPVDVGVPCGKSGVCNGKGKCGACLPEAQKCDKNKPFTCSEEGVWESQGACPASEPICSGVSCITVFQVVAGDRFSCGRLADGKVRCFGDADSGKLGQQGAQQIPGLFGVVQVAAGSNHTCALASDGTVKCWGSNSDHQLGDDTKDMRGYPALVPKLGKVAQIALGAEFSCARLQDGTVSCWGSNEDGQLGTRAPARPAGGIVGGSVSAAGAAQDRPTEVVGLSNAVELALGGRHACARLVNTSVACWGSDESGALGRASPPPPAPVKPAKPGKPVPVKPPPPLPVIKGLKDVVEIAAGADHACARLQDSTVVCWGKNAYGQLGDGATKAVTGPVKVKGLTGVAALSLGDDHSCARLQDGSVRCWGNGARSQLGDPAKADHPEPFAVPNLAGVEALSSGADHLCARLADRTYMCWGDNQQGELGSGASGETPSAILW